MDLATYGGYNDAVVIRFGMGDVIRKTRDRLRISQEILGEQAGKLEPVRITAIDKNTVSKVERDPYSSEFETVCRVLAALGLTLTDVEREVGPVFTPVVHAAASGRATTDTPPSALPAVAAADLPDTLRSSATKGMRRAARLKETPASTRAKTVGTRGKAGQKRRSRRQG